MPQGAAAAASSSSMVRDSDSIINRLPDLQSMLLDEALSAAERQVLQGVRAAAVAELDAAEQRNAAAAGALMRRWVFEISTSKHFTKGMAVEWMKGGVLKLFVIRDKMRAPPGTLQQVQQDLNKQKYGEPHFTAYLTRIGKEAQLTGGCVVCCAALSAALRCCVRVPACLINQAACVVFGSWAAAHCIAAAGMPAGRAGCSRQTLERRMKAAALYILMLKQPADRQVWAAVPDAAKAMGRYLQLQVSRGGGVASRWTGRP